ncbi:alpha/beta fold hydrolase [Goodfellowiella coeruleoviolacea]|uniref:Pimeloyl-ACP methyl ester carboxylesterase n=1 Tax=Goodfellowiella coeruleoviolacea TaxID=334858 RepID=A0AAE3KJA6_9PSEU|nr:alpha/beta hydrolase [Goodfellowiella coeruleoviolacea]MCP2170061.1 Pimeloyl-ACP methyl ester carboxylesterase [Goodfellowiella coeruleoviolacea]
MPIVTVNGIRLNYEDVGAGDPVVMVMGTGSGGRVWHLHQVPAFIAAGYRVITVDNRGIPPSDECAEGFTVDDMAADIAALVEHLGLGPCRLVGTSLGAFVVQELALARPSLVRQAVLMATRGRADVFRTAVARAEIALHDSGAVVPPVYDAIYRAVQNLSSRTLNDDAAMTDWLDLFELSPITGPGVRAQLELSLSDNRLAAYRSIEVPCQVIAFEHDLNAPPHLAREVADAIPGARFDVVPGCGHYGYLEDPVAVNKIIVEFFRTAA